MAITKIDGTYTVSTVEFSLVSGTTTPSPQAVPCVMQAFASTTSMAAGDAYQATVYEVINGTSVPIWQAVYTGAQPTAITTPAIVVSDGWEVTLKKLAGTDRAFKCSIRKAA